MSIKEGRLQRELDLLKKEKEVLVQEIQVFVTNEVTCVNK